MWEMLPPFLSIGLFFLTLIIIFVLRSSDNRSSHAATMRRFIQNYTQQIRTFEERLDARKAEIETTNQLARGELKDLLDKIIEQKGYLIEHSDDLGELQNTLNSYKEAIEHLGVMTDDVQLKVDNVNEDVKRVQEVEQTIEEFFNKINHSQQMMESLFENLNHTVEQQKVIIEGEVEQAIAKTKIDIDYLGDQAISKADTNFQRAMGL